MLMPFFRPNRVIRSIFLRLAPALSFAFLTTHIGAAETNLLVNPSVEEADPAYPSSPLGYGRSIVKGEKAGQRCAWVEGGRTGAMGVRSRVDGESGEFRINVPKDLEGEGWCRFSCWYRTESKTPTPMAVSLTAEGDGSFLYPSSTAWTPAQLLIPAGKLKQGSQLIIYSWGVLGTELQWKTDAKGARTVTNGMPVTVYLDDFEWRRLTTNDYRGNLVENPGFELGTPGHMAPGYRNIHNHGKCTGFIDERVKHSGQRSLRIECPQAGFASVTFACNKMPARPGDICAFSLWVKSSLPNQKMLLRADFNGRKWTQKDHWHKYAYNVIGAEWQKLEFMFMIPQADDLDCDPTALMATCMFRPEVSGPCQVWVDDVEFVIETLK